MICEGMLMNCNDFEILIPDYIEQKQDYPTLKCFIEHIEECPECREELTIQFLVTEGLKRMEDGNAINLQEEFQQRMEEAKQRIRFHGRFIHIGTILEIIGMGMLLALLIMIVLR